jgi:5-methylcytosine-specific restriction endonuclease McrA
MFNCKTCGIEGEEHFYKSQKWYCKSCWNKRTAQAQKDKVKQIKLDYGGKCTRCGYDKCLDALEFHHTDPTQKEFHLGEARGRSMDKLKAELEKCEMVCRNCHTEIHAEMKISG